MTISPKHHTIGYIELTATDLGAAKDFYSAAFGWQFNDYGPDYAGIVSPDGHGEVGGLNGTGDGTVGASPLVLLHSDDLDASEAAVKAAGGTIATAPFEYPGGRRFHFTDPVGNGLGVYQPH